MTVRAFTASVEQAASSPTAFESSTSTFSSPSSAYHNLGIMVQCFASGDEGRRGSAPYFRRLEKVKFGVPVAEAFIHDIPATLLVLLLKVNKQGPSRKDIWRAPGNQAHVRKLIQVMQHGRLVNIENFSVYTAASVIKKFLSKIPGGIFGSVNEERLFELLNFDDPDKRREAFCRVISSLPVPSQHLLVLLMGTFRLIADHAESCGMRTASPDAIALSVAPSLFHTCIHDGQRAKMEDIARFHMASKVVSFLVQSFGYTNLFPRENYEFYARITGRKLQIDENWRFTFQYPSRAFSQPDVVVTPEHDNAPDNTYRRLTNSLELTATAVSLDELKRINKLAESTKSLSYLEWVHERQTQRMQSRSEWFLSPDLPLQKAACASSIASTTPHLPTVPSTSRRQGDRHMSLPAGCNDDPGSSSPPVDRSLMSASKTAHFNHYHFNIYRSAADTSADEDCTVTCLAKVDSEGLSSRQLGQEPAAPGSPSGLPPLIRRQSWKTHYVRPQQGCECDSKVPDGIIHTYTTSPGKSAYYNVSPGKQDEKR